MKIKLPIFASAILILSSCGGNAPSTSDDRNQKIIAEEVTEVTVSVANKAPFFQEIVSNGKVVAGKYADLYWNVDGVIDQVFATNGTKIQKGQTIAKLESFKLQNAFEQAQAHLEQSRLSMQDVIIGQGYNPQSDTIPESVLKLAKVKSGYMTALASYNSAKYDFESATLTAPISGVVANLSDRESNLAQHGKPFCRVIDPQSLCVEFSILESEIGAVKQGERVEITAFSQPGEKWQGHVSEVNPYVEQNGMVKVRANVTATAGLCEGMNIAVTICKNMGEHIAIPKTAVVYRSRRPVVFTAKNGYAAWNYVELDIENSDLVSITKGINSGDSVIVSGNVFLSDHSAILIKN